MNGLNYRGLKSGVNIYIYLIVSIVYGLRRSVSSEGCYRLVFYTIVSGSFKRLHMTRQQVVSHQSSKILANDSNYKNFILTRGFLIVTMAKDFHRQVEKSGIEIGLENGEKRHYLRWLTNGWLHEQMGLQ